MNLKQKRMEKMVSDMQLYISTYTEQPSYLDYSDDTFINDMLYGIGIAIDPKNFFAAAGFDRFKLALKSYLPVARQWQAARKKAEAQ